MWNLNCPNAITGRDDQGHLGMQAARNKRRPGCTNSAGTSCLLSNTLHSSLGMLNFPDNLWATVSIASGKSFWAIPLCLPSCPASQSLRLNSPPAAPACFRLLFISMTIRLIYKIIPLRGKLLTPSLCIPHMLARSFYHILCVCSYLLSLTCCVRVIGSCLWESRQSETWKPSLAGSTSLYLPVQCKYRLSCDPRSFPWRSFPSSEIQCSLQK